MKHNKKTPTLCLSCSCSAYQLALKAAVLGLFEVARENIFNKHLRFMNSKALAVVVPRDNVSQSFVFCILKHLVEFAWERGFGVPRRALQKK